MVISLQDKDPKKVSLGVGAYRDDQGKVSGRYEHLEVSTPSQLMKRAA